MKSIFVSSTFSDMQSERDLVQELVAPVLRREAKSFGDYVEVVDLRWGVDTTEMDSAERISKVASTCLNAVKRSQPYMLVFLGERYGTAVQCETFKRAVDFSEAELQDDDFMSLTAMEIEYGAFLNENCDITKCVFCFRENVSQMISSEEYQRIYEENDEEYQKKLDRLKEKIRNSSGNYVIEYSAKWDDRKKRLTDLRTIDGHALSDRLIEVFQKIFISDWENYARIAWQDKEQMSANTVMERHLRSFGGRETLLEECYKQIENNARICVLKGKIGCGKTSVMCKLAQRIKEKSPEIPLFLFFAEMSVHSDSVRELMRQIVYFLEKQIGINEHYEDKVIELENKILSIENKLQKLQEKDEEEEILRQEVILSKCKKEYANLNRFRGWKTEMIRLAELLTSDVYLFIDAIDLLEGDKHVNTLSFASQHSKMHYVISCNNEFNIYDYEHDIITEMEIPLLVDEDIKKAIQGIFKSYSKEVYIQVVKEIEKKNSAARNPLYLSMIMQRLVMMNMSNLSNKSESEIIEQSSRIVRELPENLGELVMALLEEAIERIGTHKEILRDIVNLIAISQYGIGEKDLYSILSEQGKYFNQMELALLTDGLDIIFIRHEDGRLDFTCEAIREGIRNQIKNVSQYTNMLVSQIKQMGSEEPLRYTEGMRFARMTDDGELAVELIVDLLTRGSFDKYSKLSHAIVQEAVADDGEFYLKHIDEWWNHSDENICKIIKNFFRIKWGNLCGESSLAKKSYLLVEQRVLELMEQETKSGSNIIIRMQFNLLSAMTDRECGYDNPDGVKALGMKIITSVNAHIYDTYGLTEEQFQDIEDYIRNLPIYKRRYTTRDLKRRITLVRNVYIELMQYYERLGRECEYEEYRDKVHNLRNVVEEGVDKRMYKTTAEKLYRKGLEDFTECLMEKTFDIFVKALSYWERSYENTGNMQTLWTLYQKSNELGVLFFRSGDVVSAEYFLQAAIKYADMQMFGNNEAANRKAIELAERNLKVIKGM